MLAVEFPRKIIAHNKPQYASEESDTFTKALRSRVSEAEEASRNLKAQDLSEKSFKHRNIGLRIFEGLLLAALVRNLRTFNKTC